MSTSSRDSAPDRWPYGLLLAAILLFTGAAGLIYEVAWQRYLGVLVGLDHAASAATLGVFLGGLSLGYALCGQLSARTSQPLRVYAWLELGIGAWGLLFPWLFLAVRELSSGWSFAPPLGLVAGSLGVAVPLILIPAMLMGATVPFMTRGLARTRAGLTATHARVYGLNTLGAVAGALGAAFIFLPQLGPAGAVRLAAALNVAAALLLLRTPLIAAVAGDPDEGTTEDEPVARPASRRIPGWALALIAVLSGVATMAQETALIRLLARAMGPTPLIFALVVAAFIVSIAVGSLVVSRARSIPSSALGWSCAASSGAWLLLFATYDAWPWALHALRFVFDGEGIGFGAYHALVVLCLSAVLLPAVAPLGAVLPLVFHARRARVKEAGRVSGSLLAWGALGALIGSIGGGIWLYAFVDHARVLLAAPLLTAVMACLAAITATRWVRGAALVVLVASVATLVWLPGFEPNRLVMSSYRLREVRDVTFAGPARFQDARMTNRNIVYRHDGPLDSVAVVEAPAWNLPIPRPLEIYINGKSDSNTRADRETLRLSAHLPMLLAPDASRALVIGQGTGVTLGELTLWPELSAIDLVEISPNVLRTLPLFAQHTHDVGNDPRVRLHTRDARFFLRRASEPWDVIISEPSNLWVGHNDLLFTESFFRSIASRLTDAGLLLQWVHLYETDSANVCSVVATMDRVFAHMQAFRGTEGDWLVVASRAPLEDGDAHARARWSEHAEVQLSSKAIGIESFDDLWSRRVAEFPDYVARSREQCPVHTDLDTRLSHRAVRAMFSGRGVSEAEL